MKYLKFIERKRKQSIANINRIIKQNKGIWKNKKQYNGSNFVCKIVCYRGHEFKVGNRRLQKGAWCSICNGNYSKGEEICRVILEEILKISFPKTRNINGLICPITKYPIEIDGFNFDKKMGFEYQGSQHVKFTKFFHKNVKKYKELCLRDNFKEYFFKKNNMVLIKIDQFKSFEINYVVDLLVDKLNSINIRVFKKNINMYKIKNKIKKIIMSEKYRKECEAYCRKFNYKIVSGNFLRKSEIITLKKDCMVEISVEKILQAAKNNRDLSFISDRSKWNMIVAKKIINKYKYLKDFRKKESGLYCWIIVHNQHSLISHLLKNPKLLGKKNFKYTDDFLIKKAQAYKSKKEMIQKEKTLYNLIFYRKIQKKAFKHII